MSDDQGAFAVIALLLAWIGYRAGSRTRQMRITFGDHRDMRHKLRVVGKLRWGHFVGAFTAWVILVIAGYILLSLAQD